MAERDAAGLSPTLTEVFGLPVAVKGKAAVAGRQSGVVLVLTSVPGKPSTLSERSLPFPECCSAKVTLEIPGINGKQSSAPWKLSVSGSTDHHSPNSGFATGNHDVC